MNGNDEETFDLRRADRPSSIWLRAILGLCLLSLAAIFYFHPVQTFLSSFSVMAWLSVWVAVLRLLAICRKKPLRIDHPDGHDYQTYSVLVPIYQEANMVPLLMSRLQRLDYPQDCLEILIICEESDPETIQIVQQNLRSPFRLIVTPKGTPQTKPRALNFALQFAAGELITIYDAEDKPHPQQLKAACFAFQTHPEWAALQAPLDYYNSETNWLTRQFSLEYAALFHVWLPFLAELGAPFPLGGTSNHIRRSALDACGGWDAYNVTEDADLSFRLAALDKQIGFLDCPTEEEAVANLKVWHKQRSRWMKGYMQSWLVHMHKPFQPRNRYGMKRFLILQLTLGYTLLCACFFAPSVLLGCLYLGLHYVLGFTLPFSTPYFIALGISLCIGIIIGVAGAIRRGKPALTLSAPLMPVYWFLLFWPTVSALIELWRRPSHWHKTPHGVSQPVKDSVKEFTGMPAE